MPARTSDDVRWLVVRMHNLKCGNAFISAVTKLCDRTVRGIIAEWRAAGTVESELPKGNPGRPRALSFDDASYLCERINNSPTAYLDELRDDVLQTLGISVHVSTISRTMKRYNITRKKVSRNASERSEEKRDDYRIQTAGIPASYFVFIDESSVDRRTTTRDMGYSPQGERAQHDTNFVRGDRYSILPALSIRGMIDLSVEQGAFTMGTFRDFIERLLTKMNPYPAENSIIVMDNCRIHKHPDTLALIVASGMRYIFLPPYSPDFNPIELAFSKIKRSIRRDGDQVRLELSDRGPDAQAAIIAMFYQHVYSVTEEDARGWYRHCHYV